ncbi:MAG: hypothetical protein IID54_01675 [Proteobacteria bacterium]|nr:hypothetical protein [Pseudomonadota bacterium]
MSVLCYVSPKKTKAMRLCTHFAFGCNGAVMPAGHSKLEPGPAFFYGWTEHTHPLFALCQLDGREWYYADNAYYFGRSEYFRITRNGFMHDGTGRASAYGRKRAEALGVHMSGWRKPRHGPIIITTQSELFYSVRLGTTRTAWAEAIKRKIEKHTSRPVVILDKPESRDMHQTQPHALNLETLLGDAWALVTHSSSAGIAALCAGVPVFAVAPSMMGTMGISDLSQIESPRYPDDRERWISVLMANQWTLDEIASGEAMDRLAQQGKRVAV